MGKVFEPNANISGIFTQSFTSTGQTITSSGTLVISHGLGAVPELVQLRISNVTGEHGWSPGDVYLVNLNQLSNSGSDLFGAAIYLDSAKVFVLFATGTPIFNGLRKTDNAPVDFTNANWRLIVKAWA